MRQWLNRGTFKLATVLAASHIWCQSPGRLIGNVVDPHNKAVPNATIVLMRIDGDVPLLYGTTGTTGDFSIPAVPPQTYKLRITHDGFQTQEIRALKISPGVATVENNLRIDPGPAASTNTAENAETVQKADNQINTTLTNDQLRWLPQLLRDPLQLINTQAGVSSNGSTFTTIDGLRPSYNNVTLDGINIQDNYYRLKSLDFIPNRLLLDQISEFTLITSNANSIYGNGASQVAFASPSGQNSYHGGAYFMASPGTLNSNEWFNNANALDATYKRYQGGAKLGAPIKKDKLLFYVDYEFLRIRDSTQTQLITPEPTTRQGIYNGSSVLLPGQALDPNVQRLLATLPSPTSSIPGVTGFGIAQLAEPDDQSRHNVSVRLDYRLTSKQNLSATYAWNREFVNDVDAVSVTYLPVGPLLTDDNRHFLSISWRAAITPNLTNDLRGGFNLAPITFSRLSGLPLYLVDLSQLQFDFNVPSAIGIPLLAGTENKLYQPYASIDPLSNDWGDGRATNTYNLQDNAAWATRGHNLQFGFQTQAISDAISNSNGITPLYQFGATDVFDAGNELMAVLTGKISLITQSFNVTNTNSKSYETAPSIRHYRYNNYSLYLQDAWRISRRLIVNAGVRYELYPPARSTDGLALTPQLGGNSPIDAILSPRAAFQYASGSIYNSRHIDFAPAAGVAFDPSGSGRTVLRAGYSIAYVNDDLIGAIDSTLTNNLGLLVRQSGPPPAGATLNQAPFLSMPAFPASFTLADIPASNPEGQRIGMVDPSLRVPYVQEWSVAFQRILRGFLMEARYVGNHATGMIREVNYNQVDICGSGFLNDFLAASHGNQSQSCQSTSENNFNAYYSRIPPGSFGFSQDVRTGQVAQAAAEYNALGKPGYALYRNGNALGGATIIGNYASSSYNGLQLNARRQLRSGLQLQLSYTFSRDLSDSARTGDPAFEPYREFAKPGLDRARTPFDLTHAFKGNFIYELPSGKGLNRGVLEGLLAGWSVSGVVVVQSGNPFSILSGYATVDTITASLNTADADVSGSALNRLLGVRQVNGVTYFIDPASAHVDFGNPAPGRLGFLQQRAFSGPWVSDLDLGLQKTVRVKEGQDLEIRGEALNVLNHTSWLIADQNINAFSSLNVVQRGGPVRSGTANPAFGQITNTFYPSRKIQVSVYYRF